jgi:hypothetical protein
MRSKFVWAGISIIIAGTAVTGLTVAMDSTAAAQSTPLIYECSATPCTNNQEFEVFDGDGNPIYSVGETGGDAVFGDNRSVFAPGSVYNPSIVESYTTPAEYAATHSGDLSTCVAPALWISPTGLYTCDSAGAWTEDIKLGLKRAHYSPHPHELEPHGNPYSGGAALLHTRYLAD